MLEVPFCLLCFLFVPLTSGARSWHLHPPSLSGLGTAAHDHSSTPHSGHLMYQLWCFTSREEANLVRGQSLYVVLFFLWSFWNGLHATQEQISILPVGKDWFWQGWYLQAEVAHLWPYRCALHLLLDVLICLVLGRACHRCSRTELYSIWKKMPVSHRACTMPALCYSVQCIWTLLSINWCCPLQSLDSWYFRNWMNEATGYRDGSRFSFFISEFLKTVLLYVRERDWDSV